MKPDYARLTLSIATFLMGVVVLYKGIEIYNLDIELKQNGVRTPAEFVGYHYKPYSYKSQSGDIPKFSYTRTDGTKLTHIAYEYGIASKYNKITLPITSFKIIYLPNRPEVVKLDLRINPYERYYVILMGSVLCLLSFGLLKQALTLTHESSGTVDLP